MKAFHEVFQEIDRDKLQSRTSVSINIIEEPIYIIGEGQPKYLEYKHSEASWNGIRVERQDDIDFDDDSIRALLYQALTIKIVERIQEVLK